MTLGDILAQVLALLQCERRLSYRALQRRFALEEAALAGGSDLLWYSCRIDLM
jgi:hypothetical protein